MKHPVVSDYRVLRLILKQGQARMKALHHELIRTELAVEHQPELVVVHTDYARAVRQLTRLAQAIHQFGARLDKTQRRLR